MSCVVKIGIFICTDGRLLTWVDNAGNKSFSPLNHITVTKLHGYGFFVVPMNVQVMVVILNNFY